MAESGNVPSKAEMLANVRRAYRQGELGEEAVARLEAAGYDLLKYNFVAGVNDLASVRPDLAEEWHPTKNGDLRPEDVPEGSTRAVWWRCKEGHEWRAEVLSRTRQKTGCPYCSNKRLLVGFNDLESRYSDTAAQWHPTRNGGLSPRDVTYGTNKRVWWKCGEGHEWQASVCSRTKGGANCPFCGGKRAIPGETDLATTHPRLADEWHPTKNGDLKPTDVKAGSGKRVWWRCKEGHEWQALVSARTCFKAGRKPTGCPYCSRRRALQGVNDLATAHPELVKQWHPTKNGGLKPEEVAQGSSKSVWWKCAEGHEWQAKVSNRTYGGQNCPFCAGQKIVPGETDLATTHPELAKQWHPTKNGSLKPTDVKAGSHKKVWWRCDKGHEWEAAVGKRSQGQNCPYCGNKRLLAGFNDLATRFPELAKQWSPVKNGDLTPADVLCGSARKIWWKCELGHEWQAAIVKRIAGNNCPYCGNKRLLVGFNDLKTRYPEVAAQWHPTKNGDLLPVDVTYGTNKRVWWKCEEGHEWQAPIYSRTQDGSGCPQCSKRGRKREAGNDGGL